MYFETITKYSIRIEMNKKKKASRLKHRKNRERMKNLIRISQLKAKPKKVAVPKEIETAPPITAETVEKSTAKKTFFW